MVRALTGEPTAVLYGLDHFSKILLRSKVSILHSSVAKARVPLQARWRRLRQFGELNGTWLCTCRWDSCS